MAMISYAQNREDVLLHRALPQATGFYIDVGAADPVGHSVTKYFYDAGWSGINIEPLAEFHQRLVTDRTRDVNLNVAAAEREGKVTLYEVPSCIGWATVDTVTSERHSADGVTVVPRTVEAVTLASVCERYVHGTIDFLKIDVEGAEAAVLAGMDFSRWRPRVLVIEATEPGRSNPNHDSWEHLVRAADYHFAAFDGLNRFFVRSEDRNLADVLAVPVNVFDDYILADVIQERNATAAVREELATLRADLVLRQTAFDQQAGELAAIRIENALLRTALTERDAELNGHRQSLAERTLEIAAARSEIAQRRSEIETLNHALAQLRADYASALRILTMTREHLETLRTDKLYFAA